MSNTAKDDLSPSAVEDTLNIGNFVSVSDLHIGVLGPRLQHVQRMMEVTAAEANSTHADLVLFGDTVDKHPDIDDGARHKEGNAVAAALSPLQGSVYYQYGNHDEKPGTPGARMALEYAELGKVLPCLRPNMVDKLVLVLGDGKIVGHHSHAMHFSRMARSTIDAYFQGDIEPDEVLNTLNNSHQIQNECVAANYGPQGNGVRVLIALARGIRRYTSFNATKVATNALAALDGSEFSFTETLSSFYTAKLAATLNARVGIFGHFHEREFKKKSVQNNGFKKDVLLVNGGGFQKNRNACVTFVNVEDQTVTQKTYDDEAGGLVTVAKASYA